MEKKLVIVESPSKAKTIGKYLGKNYTVKASIGHIIDLPPTKLGVDIKNNFKPDYEVIKGKNKVIEEIKKAAKTADAVYLAPDPDREGEAIAWHIANTLKAARFKTPPIHRVLFNEITKKGVLEAMEHPTELNQQMFEAQQARRILDRIVGYQISPLLWDKVRRGLSAGRVQSVAVRLVCEREAEIKSFVPEEYWSLEVKLEGSLPPAFLAHLHKIKGEKADLKKGEEAHGLVETLKKASFVLQSIQKKEQKRNPSPPFITSKLQQEASRKLGFSPKKTMMLAQSLYEGVEMADGEVTGLITYMRTDSVRVSDTAIQEVRGFIQKNFGKEFLPDSPNYYKSKKSAQDAHEAIRPTSMAFTPEEVKAFLKKDEFRLYELIWKRFVASQMAPAKLDKTVFIIVAADCEFRANGSVITFPGFISVYTEGHDAVVKKKSTDEEEVEEEEGVLPVLKEGEALNLHEFIPSQHFTQPPPRFTEASLVKELEEKGIGRPSTYASILTVIQEKKYVEKTEAKNLRPTDLGVLVNDLLVKHFPDILDVQFTANLEEELDHVEEGKLKWVKALEDFYAPFSKVLDQAKVKMRDVKRQEILTDIQCEKCGSTMVIKFGRNGEFLACQKYPDCKNTKEFKRNEEGKIEIVVFNQETGEVCDKCGAPMIIKRGRFGQFMACSKYPECKNAKPIPIGVNCPKCGKALTERRSKRGRNFYGCTGYPKCDFASWNKPVPEPCPSCGAAYLVEKYSKAKGVEIVCGQKECDYVKPAG